MKNGDRIIEDLHRLREKIGRRYDFDVRRIGEAIRRREKQRRTALSGVRVRAQRQRRAS